MIRVRSEHLASGFLFIAIGVLACLAPVQSDTWWLLRAGRDIWTTGTIPLTDTYSYTAAGRYWWNHEWLSEVVFYAAFRAGGLPLLVAICAGAIVATWLLCWRMTRGAFEWRFAVMVSAVAAAAGSWAIRPQAFSMLLFAVICHALAHGRLVRVPLLVVLWINLHGAGVLALVAIAGAGAAVTVMQRRIAWPFVWTFAASVVATCLSPIGYRMYPEILASVERSRINQLIEWLPPGWGALMWPFWALGIAVPVSIALKRARLDDRTARLLGIALTVLPLAVRSTRNVHIFLIAAIPAVTSAWAGAPRPVRTAGEREGVNGALLTAAAGLAAVFVGFIWSYPPTRSGWRPIRPEVVAAIEQCDGPLYNTYGDGGVLIWFTPGTPVFIDNRQDPYSNDVLRLNKALETSGQYAEAFDRYGIRCAAVAPASLIGERLRADPGWTVLRQDARWVVLRRGPSPARP